MPITSLSRHLYFCGWCEPFNLGFLNEKKSKASQLIRQFTSYIETQFSIKIKWIRSDQGQEFNMPEFYANKETIYQTSCISSPQQNSVLDKTSPYLKCCSCTPIQAHLPIIFWNDCVIHAVHLINRIPSPILHNKTPIELLYNSIPTYSHLIVFYCLAYASISSKFAPRTKKCIFLGFPPGIKGYKLYVMLSQSIFVPRDVIFHEKDFLSSRNISFPHHLLPKYWGNFPLFPKWFFLCPKNLHSYEPSPNHPNPQPPSNLRGYQANLNCHHI